MATKKVTCKFCDFKANGGHVMLNKETAEYSGLTISVISTSANSLALLRVRSLTDDRMLVDSEDAVSINFCPMCGRKISNIT